MTIACNHSVKISGSLGDNASSILIKAIILYSSNCSSAKEISKIDDYINVMERRECCNIETVLSLDAKRYILSFSSAMDNQWSKMLCLSGSSCLLICKCVCCVSLREPVFLYEGG